MMWVSLKRGESNDSVECIDDAGGVEEGLVIPKCVELLSSFLARFATSILLPPGTRRPTCHTDP